MQAWKRSVCVMMLLALSGAGLVAAHAVAVPVRASDRQPEQQEQVNGEAGANQDAGEAAAQEEKPEAASDPMKEMREELQRLQTEYQLLQQRQKNELLENELERQRLEAQAALLRARNDQEVADLRARMQRMEAQDAFRRAEATRALTDLEIEQRRMSQRNALLMEEVRQGKAELDKIQQSYATQVAELRGQLSVRDAQNEIQSRVLNEAERLKNPFVDGTLYISDRRIPLNGPIMSGTADYVTERIDFFNNQSKELPIFIVIDSSPGGSVMEGYRIVKAIESSPAPIHVVVRSYAASMAAIITTLADHSYAYPNAIILHHQMSSGMRGNLTQQREQLENSLEWARRLADPVAKKMGVSQDEFVRLMYQNNSDGDWAEFADKAKELKWVNHVVHNIRETGVRDRPTSTRFSGFFFLQEFERTDSEGRKYIELPRLQPFDHYFMHNPDGFYRLAT